ncbi:RNA polymerase Rpc34 [Gorgonomyces haynaldii]|nr:RNA polymerase Rpc34 [Gorgonomyces haynaldii]
MDQITELLAEHAKGLPIPKLTDSLNMDLEQVMMHLNSLVKEHRVELLTFPNGQTGVKLMELEESEKQQNMQQHERVVYQVIRQVGNKGIWLKDIRQKSNLHLQMVNQAVKSLEKSGIIKTVKSIKQPTKKLYMLAEFEPGAELTGGSWYQDNQLDETFIETINTQILRYITNKSSKDDGILPKNARYPTITDIHKYLDDSNILAVSLSPMEVKELVDRLWAEGLVNRIHLVENDDNWDSFMYRTIPEPVDVGNAFVSNPCGICPVFSFCKPGGPVSPESCVYMTEFIKW